MSDYLDIKEVVVMTPVRSPAALGRSVDVDPVQAAQRELGGGGLIDDGRR